MHRNVLMAVLFFACSPAPVEVAQAPAPGLCEVSDYTQQGLSWYGIWYRPTFCIGTDRCYDAANVTWDGSDAILRVEGGTNIGAEMDTTSGDYQYGSFRAVMKTTSVPGTVSGFFYYKSDTSEIDIEILSDDPTKLHAVIHPNIGPSTYQVVDLGFDASADYHEYGFDWHPDRVEYYVDGALATTLYANVPSLPGTIIVNHWSNGGSWSGGPPAVDAFLRLRSTSLCAWSDTPDAGGGSVVLDGFDESLDMGPAWGMGTWDSWAVEAWIKTTDGLSTVWSKRGSSSSAPGIQARVRLSGKLEIRLASSDKKKYIYVKGTSVVTDGAWHLVRFTYDGTGQADGLGISVDGVPDELEIMRDNLGGRSLANSRSLKFGALGTSTDCFRGGIFEPEVVGVARWVPGMFPVMTDVLGSADGTMINMEPEDIVPDEP